MITKDLIVRLIKIKADITMIPLEHYGLKIAIQNDAIKVATIISFLDLDDYNTDIVAVVINEMIKSLEEKIYGVAD